MPTYRLNRSSSLEHEPQAFFIREDIQLAELNNALLEVGAQMMPALGRVDYLSICQIRKANGGHIVIDGAKGPVTILMLPGEHVMDRIQFRNERFQGVIFPGQAGSLAIIGEHGEHLEEFVQRVCKTVKF
ncbi:MAG TPA: DUF3379 family protein [Sulfuricaulis sp.]